jgi:hypothetical protein
VERLPRLRGRGEQGKIVGRDLSFSYALYRADRGFVSVFTLCTMKSRNFVASLLYTIERSWVIGLCNDISLFAIGLASEARSTGGDPIVGIAGDDGALLRISPLNLRGNVYLSFPARLAAGLCGWRATFANERVL